ncbi:sigma-70 family RNA polymerase sigma factor [Reichenbachiella sp. MALMAid0571]|uniref:RNA polymerase sigma factor n=1 Tax=Reichenbachiella sp. MALMAid0571 TaxID=3143939 RepID=UPI0032DF682D
MPRKENQDQEEIILWEMVRSNDLQAFNQIYRIHYPRLMYIGKQLHCDEETTKDLLHDTFIEIYERRASIKIRSSLKFYLIRCFKSHLHKHIRQNQEHLKVIEEEEKEIQFTFSIQQEIIQNQSSLEQYASIEKEINALTSRQREAMYYYFKEGFDYDEITELMSLKTRRSAQNLIYEAIKIIKSRLLSLLFFVGVSFKEIY